MGENTPSNEPPKEVLTAKKRRPPARVYDLWVVVRMPSVKTLDLAMDLKQDGILSWTPKAWISKRYPRRKKRRLVMIPILPGVVFVHSAQYKDFLRLRMTKYWFTSVPMFNGKEMMVPESELRILAEHDKPQKPTPKQEETEAIPESREEIVTFETYEPGDWVEVNHPLFPEALRARVLKSLPNDEYQILPPKKFAGTWQFPSFFLRRAASSSDCRQGQDAP